MANSLRIGLENTASGQGLGNGPEDFVDGLGPRIPFVGTFSGELEGIMADHFECIEVLQLEGASSPLRENAAVQKCAEAWRRNHPEDVAKVTEEAAQASATAKKQLLTRIGGAILFLFSATNFVAWVFIAILGVLLPWIPLVLSTLFITFSLILFHVLMIVGIYLLITGNLNW